MPYEYVALFIEVMIFLFGLQLLTKNNGQKDLKEGFFNYLSLPLHICYFLVEIVDQIFTF